MKQFAQFLARFAKLSLRERLLATAAVAALIYFAADMVLLAPQQKAVKALRQLDKAHKAELLAINTVLAEMESEAAKGGDPMAKDRATLAELKRQIAEVNAFLGQSDADAAQLGTLVRQVLAASPRLTLMSLKTLPATIFYSPGQEAPGSRKPVTSAEIQKTIYRHGVEVSIKGPYLELVNYLEYLQKYPRRLFWPEARLDVGTYPDALLKVVIYTLSDQPSLPLH